MGSSSRNIREMCIIDEDLIRNEQHPNLLPTPISAVWFSTHADFMLHAQTVIQAKISNVTVIAGASYASLALLFT